MKKPPFHKSVHFTIKGLLWILKSERNFQFHIFGLLINLFLIVFFELSNIHLKEGSDIIEKPILAMLLSGSNLQAHWSHEEKTYDFYDMKGLIENIFDQKFLYQPSSFSLFHPGRQAQVLFDHQPVGTLAQVHPTILSSFDIKNVFGCGFNNAEYCISCRDF